MSSGLVVLINGSMPVRASGRGGLLLRSDPAHAGSLVTATAGRRFEVCVAGAGWLHRAPEVRRSRTTKLQRWVCHGLAYARSLAPKRGALDPSPADMAVEIMSSLDIHKLLC